MIKKYWPEVVVALLEIFLALVPSINIFGVEYEDTHKYEIFTLQATVFFLFVLFRLRMLESNSNDSLNIIKAEIKQFTEESLRINILHEDDFYSNFSETINSASKSVLISHLDIKPPTKLKGSSSKKYYDDFFRLVKSKSIVRYKRVERVSKEKIEWIETIINKLKDSDNFSLRCFISENNDEKLGAISVQLIDDNYVYLVAVSGHTMPHTKRDILIRGREINMMWQMYYEDILWNTSHSIIENGRLNQENWDILKQKLEA